MSEGVPPLINSSCPFLTSWANLAWVVLLCWIHQRSKKPVSTSIVNGWGGQEKWGGGFENVRYEESLGTGHLIRRPSEREAYFVSF